MADGSEAVWRTALMAKGKDWVSAELRRRPGQPGDAVYDVVFEDPLPTREFCQRWCAEEENRLVRFSWEKVAAIVFLVLTIVCAVGAVKSWNDTPPPQGRSRGHEKRSSGGLIERFQSDHERCAWHGVSRRCRIFGG